MILHRDFKNISKYLNRNSETLFITGNEDEALCLLRVLKTKYNFIPSYLNYSFSTNILTYNNIKEYDYRPSSDIIHRNVAYSEDIIANYKKLY